MLKRFFDIFVSGVGLLCLWPLFLVIAILIKLDSEGPVFFRQIRVGRHEKLFRIHKFRSMAVRQDDSLLITVGKDLRVTRVGKFIRKYKLDELPQLIDVFIGNMSLVGPRPEVPKYVNFYPERERGIIFLLRPGITDWASIRFRSENELLSSSSDPERSYIEHILPIKISYFLEYSEKRTFLMDLKIIFITLGVVFK